MSTDPVTRFRLEGRTAFITGASSGIGAALAEAFAGAGASVALVARRVERLDALAQALRANGTRVSIVALDVNDTAGRVPHWPIVSCMRPWAFAYASCGP